MKQVVPFTTGDRLLAICSPVASALLVVSLTPRKISPLRIPYLEYLIGIHESGIHESELENEPF
jgi:hypothetical protein